MSLGSRRIPGRPWQYAGHAEMRAYYRGIVHPDLANLYFVGLFEAQHALLPIAEEQAAWTARVLSGRIPIPPPEERRRAAGQDVLQRRKDSGDRRPFFLEWATYSHVLKR